MTWATKVLDRTTSRVVTPKSLFDEGKSDRQPVNVDTLRATHRRREESDHALLGVESTGLLEDLGSDGDGRVDGVGDDEDGGLGAVVGDALGEVSDDRGVRVEEVVSGHSGLSGNTSGDDNDLSTGEGALEVLLGESLDLEGRIVEKRPEVSRRALIFSNTRRKKKEDTRWQGCRCVRDQHRLQGHLGCRRVGGR